MLMRRLAPGATCGGGGRLRGVRAALRRELDGALGETRALLEELRSRPGRKPAGSAAAGRSRAPSTAPGGPARRPRALHAWRRRAPAPRPSWWSTARPAPARRACSTELAARVHGAGGDGARRALRRGRRRRVRAVHRGAAAVRRRRRAARVGARRARPPAAGVGPQAEAPRGGRRTPATGCSRRWRPRSAMPPAAGPCCSSSRICTGRTPRRCRCSRTWSGPSAGRRCSSPARCARRTPHGLHALLGDLRAATALERVDLAGLSEDDVSVWPASGSRSRRRASSRRRSAAAQAATRCSSRSSCATSSSRAPVTSRRPRPPRCRPACTRSSAGGSRGFRRTPRARSSRGRSRARTSRWPRSRPSATRATTPSPRRSRRRSRPGLIDEAAVPGRYRFAHALVRESVLAGLSATRRALLHRSLAGALDAQPGRAGEVARHLLEARPLVDAATAARAALRAAEEATRRLAYEDAAELLERAGHVEGDARLRTEVLLAPRRRAPALRRRRLGRPLLRGRGRRGACARRRRAARAGGARRGGLTVTVGPVRGEVRALLEEALAAVDPDSPLRPRLLSRLAIESYYARPTTLRERLSEEALATGGGSAGARCSRRSAPATSRCGAPRTRRSGCGSPMSSWRRRAPRATARAELQGVNWRVADLVELGDLAQARSAIDEHERLAGELRLLGFAWYVPMWRAMLALMAGRLDEAQRFAEEGERIGQAAGDRNAALLFQVQRLAVRYYADRLTDADVAEIEEAARRSPAGAAWRMWATAIALLRGDRERGRRRVLEEARRSTRCRSTRTGSTRRRRSASSSPTSARRTPPRPLSARAALPPPGGHVGSRERLQRLGRALAGPARGHPRRRRGRRRPPRGGGAAQRRARSGAVRGRGAPCARRPGGRRGSRRRAAPRGRRGDDAARPRSRHARLTLA